MEDYTKLTCSYCGRHEEEVDIILSGDQAHICDQCIELMYDTLQMARQASDEPPPSEKPRPRLRLIKNEE